MIVNANVSSMLMQFKVMRTFRMMFVLKDIKYTIMEKRAKLEAMDKMLRELDDVKNSQTSLLKKIAQLEAENINAGVSLLDKSLPDVHGRADDTIQTISKLIDDLQTYRDDFEIKNNLNVPLEESEAKG